MEPLGVEVDGEHGLVLGRPQLRGWYTEVLVKAVGDQTAEVARALLVRPPALGLRPFTVGKANNTNTEAMIRQGPLFSVAT
jgi:hypothetical protein